MQNCKCSFVCLVGIKSMHHTNPSKELVLYTVYVSWKSFCLSVYIMQAVSSLIKELKCWVSVSPSPSAFFFFFPNSALEQSHRGIRETLTDTKQDTALRQDRRGTGCPISVLRLLLCSGFSLAFQTCINQLVC